MRYFVYRLSDGEIIGAGDVPDSDFNLQQAPAGHAIAEGVGERGQFYRNGSVIDIADPGKEWEKVRIKRDILLQQCDWTQLPDVPITTKEQWSVYRQALRDITNQSDPFNITWPVAPRGAK